MPPSNSTLVYRFFHLRNLPILLDRRGLHAPNCRPDDKHVYTTIHNWDIQQSRRVKTIPCGQRGVIHDYVPFYFGPRSPMLYQLHTGWLEGYMDGQRPLIYAVSTAQRIAEAGLRFVFSDGHGIAAFTKWYEDLDDLNKVDWTAVHAKWWRDTPDDMDLQRRKQAEFLVHRFCPWELIEEIGVIDAGIQRETEKVLADFPVKLHKPVKVRPDWYYD